MGGAERLDALDALADPGSGDWVGPDFPGGWPAQIRHFAVDDDLVLGHQIIVSPRIVAVRAAAISVE